MPLNCWRVSGNVRERTISVRPMIAHPQLPPITSWTPSRIWRNSQISGWNALSMMLARIIGRAPSAALRARPLTEQPLGAHWIQPAGAERIAAQQAPDGEDESPKYAVVADRLYRIVRAA